MLILQSFSVHNSMLIYVLLCFCDHLVSSETHQQLAVKPISVTTSYKLLGVQIAFNANTTTQATAFKDKCVKMANLFNQLHLPHVEAHAGYIGVVLQSLRYSLPATSIPSSIIRKHQKILTINNSIDPPTSTEWYLPLLTAHNFNIDNHLDDILHINCTGYHIHQTSSFCWSITTRDTIASTSKWPGNISSICNPQQTPSGNLWNHCSTCKLSPHPPTYINHASTNYGLYIYMRPITIYVKDTVVSKIGLEQS